jgi:preprotein translocase subunit SecB
MATNLELAGQVSRNVELDAVSLRYAKVEAGCEPGELPEEVAVDIQYRTSINRRHRKGDPSAPELAVTVEFKFHVQGKGEEAPDEILSLEASYLLTYSLNPAATIEESCFGHFAEVNGPYNAWPYWRELVQSVTGRVGLPGFVVPVFRPTAIKVLTASDTQDSESSDTPVRGLLTDA